MNAVLALLLNLPASAADPGNTTNALLPLLLNPPASAAEPAGMPATATVVSVYDGDTFTLDTGEKVRLRWVNTPEMRPPEDYAVEAREATKDLVLNKTVTLNYGPVTRDGYGRLIADAQVGDENLSKHLLELGMGHLFVIPPASEDLTALIAAQERARAANRGIWSTERYQGELHITSFHANAEGDDRANVNGEYLRVCNISTHPVDLQGYRIVDLSGTSHEFPAVILPAGTTVEIHSGKGATQADPSQQLEIYLGSEQPIWNNERDRATIYDRYGKVVDSRAHEVKG